MTIDFQTVADSTVTMRELQSMEQIRLPLAEVGPLLRKLVIGETTWAALRSVYPIFTQQAQ